MTTLIYLRHIIKRKEIIAAVVYMNTNVEINIISQRFVIEYNIFQINIVLLKFI